MPTLDEAILGTAPSDPLDAAIGGPDADKRRQSLYGAVRENPDQYGRAVQLGRESGVPAPVVSRNLPDMEQRAKLDALDAAIIGGSAVDRSMQNPDFASLSHDDVPNLAEIEALANPRMSAGKIGGPAFVRPPAPPPEPPTTFLGKIGAAFDRGLTSSLRANDAGAILDSVDILEAADIAERGDADGLRKHRFGSIFVGAGGSPENIKHMRQHAQGRYAENLVEYLRRTGDLQNMPLPADFKKFTEAEGAGPTLGAFADAPGSVTGQLISQSLGQLLPTAPLMVGGGVVGGARGLAVGTGVSSFTTGYVNDISGALTELGVDLRDKEAIKRVVASPEFQEKARQAFVKNSVIGVVDAATARVAGVKLADNPVKNIGAQTGVQMAGGAGGEVGGSVLSGQDTSFNAAFSEAIAETPGAAADVSILAANKVATGQGKAEQATQDAEALAQLSALSAASKVRMRDPQSFEQFVSQATQDGPVQDVYVDVQALQQAGIDPAQLAEVSPTAAAQLPEALATGGDLVIPVSEYAGRIAGTPLDPVLLQHLRTSDDGMSLVEAQTYQQAQAEMFKAEAEKVMDEKIADEAFTTSAKAVETKLFDELKNTGRFTDDVNNAYATLMRDFYVTTASRLGITPEEMFARYPLEIRAESVLGEQRMDQVPTFEEYAAFVERKEAEARQEQLATQERYVRGEFTDQERSFGERITAESQRNAPAEIDRLKAQPATDRDKLRQMYDMLAATRPEMLRLDQGQANVANAKDSAYNADSTLNQGDTNDLDFTRPDRPGVQSREEPRTVGGGTPRVGWAEQTRVRATSGRPAAVYRGAGRNLSTVDFGLDALGRATGNPSSGLGVWFTANRDDAAGYGEVVESFQLDIRNPKVYKDSDIPGFDSLEAAHAFRESLIAEGFDGIAVDYRGMGGPLHFVAFGADSVIVPPAPKPLEMGQFFQSEKAQRNDIGLYSAVEQAVLDMPLPAWKKEGGQAQGSEIWAKLSKTPGVKAEELKWLGIEEFLKPEPPQKFNRDQVVDFIRNNGVNVELVTADQHPEDQEQEFEWEETVDDDFYNWGSRADDFMYDYDNDVEPWFWDWGGWMSDNESEVLEALGLPEDDVLPDFKRLENEEQDKLREMARSDAEEEALKRAEEEYMQNPYYVYSDSETGITITGNDDIGYQLHDGQRDFTPNRGVYSFSEAEIQAREHAVDRGLFGEGNNDENVAKWGDYVTGGPHTKYREYKLTLPSNPGSTFVHSTHFDDENIVTFLRVTDRKVAVDGHAAAPITFFLEEMQSDWHQKGREKGYQGEEAGTRGWVVKRRDGGEGFDVVEPGGVIFVANSAEDEASAIRQAVTNAEVRMVPDAPFKNDAWMSLGLKTAILQAVYSGHDAFAWADAATLADRWSSLYMTAYTNQYDKKMPSIVEKLTGAKPVHYTLEGEPYPVIQSDEEYNARVSELGAKEEALEQQLRDMPGYVEAAQQHSIHEWLMANPEAMNLRRQAQALQEEIRDFKAEQTSPPEGYWAIPLTQELKEEIAKDSFSMFQGGARGELSFATDITSTPSVITLFKNADLSTFLHEMGHFQLEVLANIASRPDAPQGIADDMDAVLNWFKKGMTLDEWNAMTLDEKRPYHEKFARGFEAYLFEGRAPSQELQSLFQRFRAWLLNVYKSILNLNVEISDDIRQVFDRLLATEETIKAAEDARNMTPLFKSAEEMGDPQLYADYERLGVEASRDAQDTLQRRSLKDMQWLTNARGRVLKKLQRDAAKKRKSVEEEVTTEVRAMPVYAARATLKDGPKLSIEGLEAMYAGDGDRYALLDWKSLVDQRLAGTDGIHPDLAAETLGYTSGDHLVREILAAEPEAELIAGLTDQRVLERYGDLANPDTLARAADEAIHNEARAKFVATELKALSKAQGPVRAMQKAAKAFAEAMIARKKVKDIKPAQSAVAETRASKRAMEALAAGDAVTAANEKRSQLVQNYATRAAYDAVDEIEKGVKYLRKVGDSKTIDTEYTDQIDTLLERFDLRSGVTNKEAAKRAKLVEWVESQREQGFEPDIPPELLDTAMRKPYREMTLEEFRGLVDTVKQIEHLGRLKQKLLTAKDEREFAAATAAITASIDENAHGRTAETRTPTDALGKLAQQLKRFWASHIKAATWSRVLDGGKDGGPMWEYFIRTANEKGDMETSMRAEATLALSKILGPIVKTWPKLQGKGRYFESVGRAFTREGAMAIALNTGNAGNLQRLLDGEGWTIAQITPILQSLTAQELQAVQAVWDYFETYKPQIGAKEERIYGKPPEWVEPVPLTVKSADGEEVSLRGGYYPIKYDAAASQRAEEHADAEMAKRDMRAAYTTATTRRSFVKSRAEEVTGRPLLYSLMGVYSGINEVIHDLSWHEWLIDANRLLRAKNIDQAIRNHYGPEVKAQFKQWVKDVAQGDTRADHPAEVGVAWLRQSVSAAGLGFNVMSAIMQVTGLSSSIVRVGPGYIARGIAQYATSPIGAAREVLGKSPFMESRSRTQFRELNELRNRVEGQTDAGRFLTLGTYFLMMRAQKMVDVPTWLGAYEKAIAEGNNEERSIALADQAVIDSQGSGMIKDLSTVERGGQALKLFTVFYSYMNTTLNVGVTAAMTERSKAKLAAKMLMTFTVPAVLGAVLRSALTPGGDDDEEAFIRKLIAEQISFLTGLMVGVREFSEVGKIMAGADGVRDYGGPAGVRVVSDAVKAGQQIKQGEFDDAFRKAMINLLGDVTGLPSAQINKTISGAQALDEGDTDNPAALVLGYER